jgi:hypothetical protein
MVRVLDKEAVFLNLGNREIFRLGPDGNAHVASATTSPVIDTAFHELLDEYDVAPELLRTNLTELLSRLLDHGLLQIVPPHVETSSTI